MLVDPAHTTAGPLTVHAGFVILADVLQTLVQLPPVAVVVEVTVIVYPPVDPAVTVTDEPVVALKVPLPAIDQAKVPLPAAV